MPIYEYFCETCKKRTEVSKSVKDLKDVSTIPKCCNDKLMEISITKSSFILKGSCWAKDGYKK